jgi:hypothetical protein
LASAAERAGVPAFREDLAGGRLDARAHLVLENLGHQGSNSRG